MDDNDSIITEISILGAPNSFKHLPTPVDDNLYTEDLTTSSSDAVIKALQTLQEKIKKLEIERVEAEEKFGTLERETQDFKEIVKNDLKHAPVLRSLPSAGQGSPSAARLDPMYRLEPTTTPDTTLIEDTPGNMQSQHKYLSSPVTMATRPVTMATRPVTMATRPVTMTTRPVTMTTRPVTMATRPVTMTTRDYLPTPADGAPPKAGKRALYCPSNSQPYATYIRPSKGNSEEASTTQRLHDSRVSVLEKQLEYMRRLVHNAEQERLKATEKMCAIEADKENELGKTTQEELEKQNAKIRELEKECSKLSTSHFHAQDKISGLETRLQSERESHLKLILQTEELARATEENKNLVLSMTPSLPPSPPPQQNKKKKRKRPSSSGSSAAAVSRESSRGGSGEHSRVPGEHSRVPGEHSRGDCWKAMPFVCGRSAHPSHSLSANVQQMLSVLKQENPSLCARITTQKRKGAPGKEIKHVISDIEDGLGALTFECQKLTSAMAGSNDKRKLQEQLEEKEEEMEKKSQQIKKLKSYLKKLEKEPGRVALAQPVSRPLSTLSNREVQISVRGRNTRELLSKVKSIRDVLTNKDIQWI